MILARTCSSTALEASLTVGVYEWNGIKKRSNTVTLLVLMDWVDGIRGRWMDCATTRCIVGNSSKDTHNVSVSVVLTQDVDVEDGTFRSSHDFYLVSVVLSSR